MRGLGPVTDVPVGVVSDSDELHCCCSAEVAAAGAAVGASVGRR
jgi:hypothetical protein